MSDKARELAENIEACVGVQPFGELIEDVIPLIVVHDTETREAGRREGIYDGAAQVWREFRALKAENDHLYELVEACAEQFQFYVEQHLAKSPPDTAKAATNQEFAQRCRAALAKDPT